MDGLAYLFQDSDATAAPTVPPPVEEIILRIPGAIIATNDIEFAAGEFSVVRFRQGETIVAVVARIGIGDHHDDPGFQWLLARGDASVKLDDTHYLFSFHIPKTEFVDQDASDVVLNFALTFALRGQEELLNKLDGVLEEYSSFSVRKVPVHWTTIAPNVEDYNWSVAKIIAKGFGQVIRGIFWCGDFVVGRLKWGEKMMKWILSPLSRPIEFSKGALKRMRWVKLVTMYCEKGVSGVIFGVVNASGFFTGFIVNSKIGNKVIRFFPFEIVLATLDGIDKIFDAVEVTGKNVLQTSSFVITGVVSHRYGEEAADIIHEGLDATGHAIGTALVILKIRKALNPKNFVKPMA